jgi:ParB-like chromosome segregation protein Spo0J
VVLARSGDVRNRVLQLLENLQRADLSPLEEAHAYQEIIDLEHMSPPTLAERLHISAQTVRNRLRLLHDEVIADGVRSGALTVSAAQEAQKLADDGLAEIYERLRAGESVLVAQVQEIRARLSAAGVVNPRRKGQREQPTAVPLPEAAPPAVAVSSEPSEAVPDLTPSQPRQEQNVFVADRIESTATALEPQPGGGASESTARLGRTVRPTFLRLQEIDAALRNLSLDQASDEEEALAWLPVLRNIAARAERLCDALERLAGRDSLASLPEEA